LAQADDSPRFDPCLSFTALADGEYFVRIFAFPTEPNSSIRYAGGDNYIYRLTLTTGPFVRYLSPLSVKADEPTTLMPKGWNLPADMTPINLAGPAEDLSAVNPFPGMVPMTVASCDHASLLEPDSKEAEARKLTPPFSLTGTIGEADEVDQYQFPAKKDETLRIQVESEALGFPLDPVLEIRDAQGQSLQAVDDRSRNACDVDYEWKVPADGEYQIRVRDRYQHGGWDYAYLLTVAAPQPEATMSVATDAFTLAKDKPVEIPVTIAKMNGFDGKLDVQVEGLPEGFTVETSPAEKSERSEGGERRGRGRSRGENRNTESVKVKITPKADEPFHGPVWIIAKAGEKTISAQAPTDNASSKASHVWLTYQPKK
jgi:hypothetical protein